MNTSLCPQCGRPLAADSPMGLCPQCLLDAGFATGTGPAGDFVPPAPEELAPNFPELEILELLGRGGMGAVYKTRQRRLDRLVALKILRPGLGDDPSFAGRFEREARALAKLQHPNIVTIYEFGEANGQFHFLMEYVEGVTLRRLLDGGRIASREALAIVLQVCDALQFAHDHGIVHRDIKPENILLDRQGHVKIADFGVVKIVAGEGGEATGPGFAASELGQTEAGRVIGTPQYMAPEQQACPGEVDQRADVYALGVVFYQMLTGELPGKPIEPPSRKVQLDVRLDEVVLRALEREPELRYQQVSDVRTIVETIATTGQRGDSSSEPSKRVAQAKWAKHMGIGFAAGAVCFLAAAAIWIVHGGSWNGIVPAIVNFVMAGAFGFKAIQLFRFGRQIADRSRPLLQEARPVMPLKKTPMVRGLEAIGQITFTSPLAVRVGNASALGFLGCLGFLGYLPFHGAEKLFALSGFAGFFGLIGLAYLIEGYRQRIAGVIWGVIVTLAILVIFNLSVAIDGRTGGAWLASEDDTWTLVEPAYVRAVSTLRIGRLRGDSLRLRFPNTEAVLRQVTSGDQNLPITRADDGLYEVKTASLRGESSPDIRAEWSFPISALDKGYRTELRPLLPAKSLTLTLVVTEESGFQFEPQLSNPAQLFRGSSREPKALFGSCSLGIKPAVADAARPTTDQIIVEDLSLRFLAAIRDKEDNVLKSLAVDRIKGWRDALPHFAFEMRERFQQRTGKPFNLRVSESLIEGEYAVVKCTGPKELDGIYVVLFFVKTDTGWKNWMLRNSSLSASLEKYLGERPPD